MSSLHVNFLTQKNIMYYVIYALRNTLNLLRNYVPLSDMMKKCVHVKH